MLKISFRLSTLTSMEVVKEMKDMVSSIMEEEE